MATVLNIDFPLYQRSDKLLALIQSANVTTLKSGFMIELANIPVTNEFKSEIRITIYMKTKTNQWMAIQTISPFTVGMDMASFMTSAMSGVFSRSVYINPPLFA